MSFGGREVFTSKSLPSHLNIVHYQRTGRLLRYLGPAYDDGEEGVS